MKLRHLMLVLLCWVLVAVTMSGQAGSAQEALEAARKIAVIDGDLAAAIKQYQAIVTRYEKTDRAVAAQALLRMAECYEKQGSADAQRVYQRVIKQYGDQASAVAEAQKKSEAASNGTQRAEASRLVWTLPSAGTWVRGNVSANGRFLAVAAAGGGLLVRDVVAGTDRAVVYPAPNEPDVWFGAVAFSRDSRRIVFEAGNNSDGRRLGLRTANLDELSHPKVRLLTETDALPCDWSPDGKWIAVRMRTVTDPLPARRDPMIPWQLGVMSVADGSVRVLQTVQARYRSRSEAAFSPDGKYVAFEVPESEKGARDILLLAVDGSSETPVVSAPGDDALVGWSPDGGILYSTARGSGSHSIWIQPVNSGRPKGAPQLVRAGGTSWPLGLTSSGALFLGVNNDAGVSVKQAEFDTTTGTFVSDPRDVPATFVRSSRRPRWSPDGKTLGYISIRGEHGGDVFVSRDVESGVSREVPLDVFFRNGNRNLWFWIPDNRSILSIAEDPDPAVGVGLYRTDLATGKTALVVARNLGNINTRHDLAWSPDGQTLTYSYLAGPGQYQRVTRDMRTGVELEVPPQKDPQSPDGSRTYSVRRNPNGVTVVEHQLASGADRDLLKLIGYSDWSLTEQGQSIIGLTTDVTTNESIVVQVTVATGAQKVLFRSKREQPIANITSFAKDERFLIVQVKPSEGATSLFWWVPVDGRPARLLEELSGFEDVGWDFHPDGRRVALQVNYPRTTNDQIYVLENFLPSVKR